jgi:nitroreductase
MSGAWAQNKPKPEDAMADDLDLSDTDVFTILHTTRAMRRLKPDPVPDELIHKILRAGIAAANGGNTQRWRFLVVKDPEIKKAVQVHYKRAFDEIIGPRYASTRRRSGSSPARSTATRRPTAPPARRSIRRCRTCCSRRAPLGWVPR